MWKFQNCPFVFAAYEKETKRRRAERDILLLWYEVYIHTHTHTHTSQFRGTIIARRVGKIRVGGWLGRVCIWPVSFLLNSWPAPVVCSTSRAAVTPDNTRKTVTNRGMVRGGAKGCATETRYITYGPIGREPFIKLRYIVGIFIKHAAPAGGGEIRFYSRAV